MALSIMQHASYEAPDEDEQMVERELDDSSEGKPKKQRQHHCSYIITLSKLFLNNNTQRSFK